MTDQAVAERWRAGGPWGTARLRQRLPLLPVAALPKGKRVLGREGRTGQAPGATGTAPRLPLGRELGSWEFVEGRVTEGQSGETLKPCAVGPGGVGVAERGSAQPPGKEGRRAARGRPQRAAHPLQGRAEDSDGATLGAGSRLAAPARTNNPDPAGGDPGGGRPPRSAGVGAGLALECGASHSRPANMPPAS
jgi:hypothetical protein